MHAIEAGNPVALMQSTFYAICFFVEARRYRHLIVFVMLRKFYWRNVMENVIEEIPGGVITQSTLYYQNMFISQVVEMNDYQY